MQSKQRKECMSILAAFPLLYPSWQKSQGQNILMSSLIHFDCPTLRVIFFSKTRYYNK